MIEHERRFLVDQFKDRHAGIVIAEVELKSEADSQFLDICMPPWFIEEVTENPEFSNYELSRR